MAGAYETNSPGDSIALEAAVDLTGKRFTMVKVDANAQLALGTAAASGYVLMTEPEAVGRAATIKIAGVARPTAGAAIAAGALCEVNASGKVITQVAGVIVGRALQAAAADGDRLAMLIIPN